MDRGRGRRVSPSRWAILQLYGVREEIPPSTHRNLLQYPVSVPMHGLQANRHALPTPLRGAGGNQKVETPYWKQTETESNDRK